MIPPLQRIKYNYFFVYIVTMYCFFIHLNCKREFLRVGIDITSHSSLSSVSNYSSKDITSKENKIVLDLKYKNEVHLYSLSIKSFAYIIDLEGKILLDLTYKNIMSSYSLGTRSYRYVIDFEGKVLGHRVEHDEKSFSNLTSVTMNLNKKLLHSTIFGSIKLIKV